MNSLVSVLSPLALIGLLMVSGCKTGGVRGMESTPNEVNVGRTLLQTECNEVDGEFKMRFSITGLKNDPDAEADILMNVINNVNNEKVVKDSPGRGFYSDKEYIYVRFAAGGLTLDWDGEKKKYVGAATVNANPEESAVEVICSETVLTTLP